jgi:hypothetical protein
MVRKITLDIGKLITFILCVVIAFNGNPILGTIAAFTSLITVEVSKIW